MEMGAADPILPETPKSDILNRAVALIEVALAGAAGYIIIPIAFALYGIGVDELLSNTFSLFLLMVSEATMTLLIIFIFLGLRKEKIATIGWQWQSWRREAKIGLAAIPILFVSTFLTAVIFHSYFPEYVTEENPLLALIRTPGDLFLFLFSSLYVGGLKEEVQRAFILVRFEKYLGGVSIGLVLWSLFFAFGHTIQGIDNAVGAGMLGLIFGLLFIWRRSVVAPVVAHTLYNMLTLVFYWLFLR